MSFGFGFTYQPKINFIQIFAKSQLNILQILLIDDVVKQVRSSIKIFTKQLIKNQDLIKNLIDIALRPEQYINQKQKLLPQYAFIATELFCSLQDQFYSFLFNNTLIKNKRNEIWSIQTENKKPIILYIFKLLQTSNRLNDTAGGYFARIIEQGIVYQKGRQFLKIILNNNNIFDGLIQHSYCTSITNIFKHLLFIQNEQNENKQELVRRIFNCLVLQKRPIQLCQKLDNLNGILSDIIEKYSQKSEYNKKILSDLLNLFISCQNTNKLKQVIQRNKSNQSVLSSSLDILLSFLKYQKIQKNKLIARKKNINFQLQTSQNQILNQYQSIISILLVNLYRNQSLQSLTNSRIGPIKLKLSTLKLFQLLQQILFLNSKFTNFIINIRFIRFNVRLMMQHKFNNFLHNYQKQIILTALRTQKAAQVCYKQATLIDFIIDQFTNFKLNSRGYYNQLYHIITAIQIARTKKSILNLIMSQYIKWESLLLTTYSETRGLYQLFLGGENPKAQQLLFNFNLQNPKKQNLDVGQYTPAFIKIPESKQQIKIKQNIQNIQKKQQQPKQQNKSTMIGFFCDIQNDDYQQQNDYEQNEEKEQRQKDNLVSDKHKTQQTKQQLKQLNFNFILQSKPQYQSEQQQFQDDCYVQVQPQSVGRHRSNRW